MVNTLSGSVSAYRKENVKPRFIRIDEVMALLDVTRDEAMDIALAAGARYQLAKIILVHRLMQGGTQHSTSDWCKTGGDNAYTSYPVTCGAYAIQCAGA